MKFRNLFVFVVLGGLMLGSVSAQNVNRLQINKGPQQTKFFCPMTFTVDTVNNGASHTNAQFSVLFDTGNVGVSFVSKGSAFNAMDRNYYTGVGDDMYYVDVKNSASITSSVNCAKFSLTNKNTNITTTTLKLVDKFGNDPTAATFLAPVANYNLTLSNSNGNTLTGVDNTTYTFDAAPCVDDMNAPIIYGSSWIPTAIYNGQLTGIHNIEMLAIDWIGSNGHYRYSGLDNTNLSNYKEVVAGDHVDNQYGVDSGTLSVRIVNSAGGGTIEYITPIKVVYTGNYTPNKFTWDSKDRGYWIDFTNTNAFEIEKEVVITVTGYDNQNYNSQAHLMTRNFTFNTPVKPTMSMTTPVNGATFQSPTISPLKFQANDSWAGVDTGSIKIEIPQIMSGAIQLMTGHIYSGSELTFTLDSGGVGSGNAGGYEISLVPLWDFPAATGIIVSGFVADLATNAVNLATNRNSYIWSFETRPSCDFYGCNEILDIYIMTGGFSAGSPYQFTGELLVATGTNPNSPYPYLTGVDNNILMCGSPYTGTNIDSNFPMFESDGTTPLILPHVYTGNRLYITGLDFTYSNGVITVN